MKLLDRVRESVLVLMARWGLGLTNTFGASRWTLASHGLADRLAALNRAAAILARQAAKAGPSPEPAPGHAPAMPESRLRRGRAFRARPG